MRIAIFGGSFNPLHIGHLFIAEEARTELGYDKIIFVPANIPSHKDPVLKITAEERLDMLREALKPHYHFIVDDCDIRRGGISYSIDTVNHIYKNYEFEGKPGFIIGDDLLPDFEKWKSYAKLKSLVDLIVVKRTNKDKIDSVYPDFYIDNAVIPISSTDIRQRIKEGKSIKYLVTETVGSIIFQNKYYMV